MLSITLALQESALPGAATGIWLHTSMTDYTNMLLLRTVIHLRVLCCACRTAWDGAVAKPLEAASEASRAAAGGTSSGVMLAEWGRRQLLQLLTRIMIRSCKADLALLPPCYKKVRWLRHAAACVRHMGTHMFLGVALVATQI